jgi:hypothetical protein
MGFFGTVQVEKSYNNWRASQQYKRDWFLVTGGTEANLMAPNAETRQSQEPEVIYQIQRIFVQQDL